MVRFCLILLDPSPPSKSKILHLRCDFVEIWNNIFICLLIIIEIRIYEWWSPCPPSPLQKSNSSFRVWFCWNLKYTSVLDGWYIFFIIEYKFVIKLFYAYVYLARFFCNKVFNKYSLDFIYCQHGFLFYIKFLGYFL